MAEVNYQQAVQVLLDRIGMRWDGAEAGGRNEMARVLMSELGCDTRQANEMLDAMIQAGTLRYHCPSIGDPYRIADEPAGAGPNTAGASSPSISPASVYST
jgi:hypothetical protein